MIKRLGTNAEADKCFWVHQGPAVKNLTDLKEVIKTMSEEQFCYHANAEKNDFAKWIREVLNEKELAKRLVRIKTRKGAYQLLERELNLVAEGEE